MEKKKGINLSYSAVDSYLSCSEKFRLERIEKLMPEVTGMALTFGKAIDEASEIIFRDKMKTDQYLKFDREVMLGVLKYRLLNIEYQGRIEYGLTHTKIKYSKADVQPELLLPSDLLSIRNYLESKGLEVENIYQYIEYFKDKKSPDEEEIELYNYIAHYALFRKGELMLDVLKEWADNNLIEVKSFQRFFQIENDEGDVLRGLIDLEAILKSDPNKVITIDLKTATNAVKQYPDDIISRSKQLAIYSEFSTSDVGYLVLDKEIKKREPRVRLREVYGVANDELKDEVFDRIDEALMGIKAGKFEKNLDNCWNFGGCSFRGLCHYGSMKGLEKRVFDKEKK